MAERLGDVRLLALIDGDGFSIEKVSFDSTVDLDQLAAELAALSHDIVADYKDLAVGRPRQFSVLFGRWIVMLSFLKHDYSLLLVADEKIGQGRARFELRRARLTLDADLA